MSELQSKSATFREQYPILVSMNRKVFKTKTGNCYVYDNRLEITRTGLIGILSKILVGDNIYRIMTINAVAALIFVMTGFNLFNHNEIGSSILSFAFAALCVFSIVKSKNISAAPIIYRHAIRDIEFKKAVSGATRAYFIIHFTDKNGKEKKRIIMLPGSMNNGAEETRVALEIMKSEFPISLS